MDGLPSLKLCHLGKGLVINCLTIGIVSRRGKLLVEGEPLLGLFWRIVMELVIHLPAPQRFEQVTANGVRELARMNRDVRGGGHAVPSIERFKNSDALD